jgi:hypothetical protein
MTGGTQSARSDRSSSGAASYRSRTSGKAGVPDIDFVITWVDGSNPAHIEARRRFSPDQENAHRGAAAEIRFRESGEIYYLIASILKYAPFARRVHIVTDNQKPALLDSFAANGLCAPDFLRIVSHDMIFRGLDAARPTFNPRSIEAALWRIPDLAEHFIYLDDDMFLNAPITTDDFFRNGKPVIHGTMTKPDRRRLKTKLRRALGKSDDVRPKYRLAQEKGAQTAGVTGSFLLVHHHPHPMRRSTAEAFYAERPEVLREQLQYRFRNIAQYLPVALANHLEKGRHDVAFGPQRPVAYIQPGTRSPLEVLRAIRSESTPFGCVQNLETYPASLHQEIHATLQEKFRDTLPPSLQSPRPA